MYIKSQFKTDYPQNIDLTKLINLIVFLICCIHEIIGNLYLRINNYLLKNNQINSSRPQIPNNDSQIRKEKSDEYIDEIFFGNPKFEITIKEIIFALDKENYKTNNSTFRGNFMNANNHKINISKSLNDILTLYKI